MSCVVRNTLLIHGRDVAYSGRYVCTQEDTSHVVVNTNDHAEVTAALALFGVARIIALPYFFQKKSRRTYTSLQGVADESVRTPPPPQASGLTSGSKPS